MTYPTTSSSSSARASGGRPMQSSCKSSPMLASSASGAPAGTAAIARIQEVHRRHRQAVRAGQESLRCRAPARWRRLPQTTVRHDKQQLDSLDSSGPWCRVELGAFVRGGMFVSRISAGIANLASAKDRFLAVLRTRRVDSGTSIQSDRAVSANQAAYSNSDCWECLAGAIGCPNP